MSDINRKKLEKMEKLVELLNQGVSKKDFVSSFEVVVKLVKDLKKKNETEFELIHENLALVMAEMQKNNSDDVSKTKKQLEKTFQSALADLASLIQEKLADVRDGEEGPEGPPGERGLPGQDGSPDTAEEVRDKLETLKGDERLDKKAIKGLDEELTKRSRGGISLFGARGIQLYVDGAKKGMIQTLNILGGTGVTITYNYASGRHDLTISASSTGMAVLAATGTVNGSNQSFTFTSAPTILVVDGVPRQKTQSDGTANWTGTTTVVLLVAPNYDIYGLG